MSPAPLPPARVVSPLAYGTASGELRVTPDGVMQWTGHDWIPFVFPVGATITIVGTEFRYATLPADRLLINSQTRAYSELLLTDDAGVVHTIGVTSTGITFDGVAI